MSKIDHYAVFGSPINHSKSPQIHHLFAEQTKQAIEYTAQEVLSVEFSETASSFFRNGGKGLNCTLPLKELAWTYADKSTERADLCKSVNTLALQDDGTVLGDNTDGCGLIRDLTVNNNIIIQGARILILGAGGACRGILGPLLELHPKHLMLANRSPQKAYDLSAEFCLFGEIDGCGFADLKAKKFDLVINATSASLHDDMPPLPDDVLAPGGVCYDLAYGRKPTSFVRWGVLNNARKSLDGLGMLVEQAAEAFYVWRKVRPDTQPVIEALNTIRYSKRS
jgi:shikimate dehydrogenase